MEWQPTPVFLPGEFHGQRSLAVYSPWGHKELDTTVWLQFTSHLQPRNHWNSNCLTFFSPPPFLAILLSDLSFPLLLLIYVLIYLCLFSFPKLSHKHVTDNWIILRYSLCLLVTSKTYKRRQRLRTSLADSARQSTTKAYKLFEEMVKQPIGISSVHVSLSLYACLTTLMQKTWELVEAKVGEKVVLVADTQVSDFKIEYKRWP